MPALYLMPRGITLPEDLCPVCGAGGLDVCVEEDGQTVLDHWGRSATEDKPRQFCVTEPGAA